MNILILSNIELDVRNATGNTYANWFSGWKDAKFANLYCRETSPNNNFCNEYFSVSVFNIVRNIFRPWKIGKYFKTLDVSVYDVSKGGIERKLIQQGKHSNISLLYLLEDILYNSGLWMNANYKRFINDFQPDVVFFSAKSRAFFYRNIKYIKKHTNAKCVVFYADDMYRIYQNGSGLIYKIFERRFGKIIKEMDWHYGASKLMCEDYGRLFGITIHPLYKGCDIADTSESVNRPLRIVYAGNLFYGRDETLFLISKALKSINEKNTKALLEIYTSSEITSLIDKKLNVTNASRIMGARSYNEIMQILHDADIVLHVESFFEENMNIVRLSYSTKISDCLQSGSALLVVGPTGIASVEEARGIDGVMVIDKENRIEDSLRSFISDSNLIVQRAKLTNTVAKERFPITVVRKRLQDDFMKLINEV